MPEINWAENDRRLIEEPTRETAARMGSTHFAYGWACTPWGHWTEDIKQAYHNGFDEAKRKAAQEPE